MSQESVPLELSAISLNLGAPVTIAKSLLDAVSAVRSDAKVVDNLKSHGFDLDEVAASCNNVIAAAPAMPLIAGALKGVGMGELLNPSKMLSMTSLSSVEGDRLLRDCWLLLRFLWHVGSMDVSHNGMKTVGRIGALAGLIFNSSGATEVAPVLMALFKWGLLKMGEVEAQHPDKDGPVAKVATRADALKSYMSSLHS